MNGLRVYCSCLVNGRPSKTEVFYSRRCDGPYYEWGYDEKSARWSGVRMAATEIFSRPFDLAKWKSLPEGLRSRLQEHYLD